MKNENHAYRTQRECERKKEKEEGSKIAGVRLEHVLGTHSSKNKNGAGILILDMCVCGRRGPIIKFSRSECDRGAVVAFFCAHSPLI